MFRLRVSERAKKEYLKLDRPTRSRLEQRFEELRQDPFDARLSAPLTNKEGLRKSRLGGWRIIFSVDRGELVVLILIVGRRGQVYQRMQ